MKFLKKGKDDRIDMARLSFLVSSRRDLHDNLKMSISFTDLAVGVSDRSSLVANLISSNQ